MIASSSEFLNGEFTVPVEATAFLGAVAAFVVLLLVFFLYLNKKWCFTAIGGFPCCDEPITRPTRALALGKSYSYEEPESSSDSEEDVLRRLQQSASFHSGPPLLLQADTAASTPREPGAPTAVFRHAVPVLSKPVPLLPPPPSASSSTPRVQAACDLISLAEKGKVGPSSSSAASSSSSSSSTASSTSGDEEQQQLHQKALRHRETTRAAIAAPAAGYRKLVKPTDEEAPPLSPTSAYQDSIPDPECVVVQTDLEPLFDVTDLQSRRESAAITSQPVSKCGQLELAFAYDAPGRKMTVHVLQARDVPSKDRGGSSHTQVRLVMLPTKKQKHKTKIRQGENPQFMESFLLHRVNPEDVNSMGVRLRLYGCERMRRERLIGEYVVGFAGLNLELETTMWLPLEARANLAASSSASELLSLARSDSTGSTHSMQMMQHGGVAELLLGLSYNGTTGRLSVEIVKGSHFRTMAMTRAPDSYVKLCLVSSSGQEMARSKTSIRRGQPNPLFKETFMFQVALFQLPDVTLMISVYNKRSMKRKEMLGWFSLGLSSTGHEEMAHWSDMRDNRCEQVCRWHVLIDS